MFSHIFLTFTFTWVTVIATSDSELLLVAAAWWQLFVTSGSDCHCGQPLNLLLWWFCCSCEYVTSDVWTAVQSAKHSGPISSCRLHFRHRCLWLAMFRTRTGRVTTWLAFGIRIKPNVFKWGRFVICVSDVPSDVSTLPCYLYLRYRNTFTVRNLSTSTFAAADKLPMSVSPYNYSEVEIQTDRQAYISGDRRFPAEHSGVTCVRCAADMCCNSGYSEIGSI